MSSNFWKKFNFRNLNDATIVDSIIVSHSLMLRSKSDCLDYCSTSRLTIKIYLELNKTYHLNRQHQHKVHHGKDNVSS